MEQATNKSGMRSRPRACGALWLGAMLAGFMAMPLSAHAHAQVVRSSPADHAALPRSPSQIEVWFNELLEDGFNEVELFPAGEVPVKTRTNLAQGKAKVDSRDRTHLIVKVPPLPPGEYVFAWRVLSRDGHSAPGKINFRVLATK